MSACPYCGEEFHHLPAHLEESAECRSEGLRGAASDEEVTQR